MKAKVIYRGLPPNHPSKKKGFRFSIGKGETRTGFLKVRMDGYPGPGFYSPTRLSSKGFKIVATAFKPAYIQQSMIEALGPGHYNCGSADLLSSHRSEYKYTFAKHRQQRFMLSKSARLNPGPGHYSATFNKLSTHEKRPEYLLSQTIRTDITFGLLPENPGPGAYEAICSTFGRIESSPKLSRYVRKKGNE